MAETPLVDPPAVEPALTEPQSARQRAKASAPRRRGRPPGRSKPAPERKARAKAPEFGVQEEGRPQLLEEDQVEPEPQTLEGDGQPPQILGPSWTPQEAAETWCAVWNSGVLLYGPDWTAWPAEAASFSVPLAKLFDKFIPHRPGATETGIGVLLIGMGIAGMVHQRMPLVKKGPRKSWQDWTEKHGGGKVLPFPAQFMPGGQPSQPAEASAAAPPVENPVTPPAAPVTQQGDGFELDKDLLGKAGVRGLDDPIAGLGGLGYGH